MQVEPRDYRYLNGPVSQQKNRCKKLRVLGYLGNKVKQVAGNYIMRVLGKFWMQQDYDIFCYSSMFEKKKYQSTKEFQYSIQSFEKNADKEQYMPQFIFFHNLKAKEHIEKQAIRMDGFPPQDVL